MIELDKESYIISSNNEYLKISSITKENQDYFYKALIIENKFSEKLNNLINEYWECIDLFSMSLADDAENEIKSYNLVLKESNTKIFDIEIKNEIVTFFLKYPTSKGFLDDYPV